LQYTTYEQAVDYILQIPKFSTKNSLAHTKLLLQQLNSPQEQLQIIHIAGTNGKGSVCVAIDTILRAQGYHVGRFTSPHLISMNERFVIDGQMVGNEAFFTAFTCVYQATERMQQEGYPHPTFFEFLFCMGCVIFTQAAVDYAVIETGLGGRLDATNVVEKPLLTGITSIGWDHKEILGDRLATIAGEKAGIIKEGVPVFYQQTQEESDTVIEQRARELGSRYIQISNTQVITQQHDSRGITFAYHSLMLPDYNHQNVDWILHNHGTYQVKNTMMAIEMCAFLCGSASRIDRWQEALQQLTHPGRMEEVRPRFFLDGAHNVSAIESFITTYQAMQQAKDQASQFSPIILFSAVQEKEYQDMIRILCQQIPSSLYVVTQIPGERSVSIHTLQQEFDACGQQAIGFEEVTDAITFAMKEQGNREVFCLGSLYLVGMIKEALLKL